MTQTDIANLALDLLGEPYLTSYDNDTGTTAEAVRLHYPVALKSLLESHPWSFATACSKLTAAPLDETYATGEIGNVALNTGISFTAVQAGPSGNEITVAIATPSRSIADPDISVSSKAIVITPANTGDKATATITFTDFPANNDTITINGQVYTFSTAFYPSTYQIGINAIPSLSILVLLTTEVINGTRLFPPSVANEDVSAEEGTNSVILTSLLPGDAGNDLTLTESAANTTVSAFSGGTDDITTAAEAVTAINASAAASLLVLAASTTGSDGTGELTTAISATNLSGGTSTSSVYAPAYGSAFNLPDDCVRLLKIDDVDIDAPLTRFEIHGRHLLLEQTNAEAPVIHYIAEDPPISDWPSTFTDAFVTLLATRLSAKLCQNDNLKQSLRNDHQLALAQAKNKDARETRSKENHGPRQLAARSGLVNARFVRTAQPPYSAS